MIFDHIGLVLPDLAAGRTALSQLFGIKRWTIEFTDPIQHVHVQFGLDLSGICYELLAPADEMSPILEALKSGRNILNHVAYRVKCLNATVETLRENGAMPVGPATPAVAFGGARIQFLLTPLRFLIELIESSQPIEHRFVVASGMHG